MGTVALSTSKDQSVIVNTIVYILVNISPISGLPTTTAELVSLDIPDRSVNKGYQLYLPSSINLLHPLRGKPYYGPPNM